MSSPDLEKLQERLLTSECTEIAIFPATDIGGEGGLYLGSFECQGTTWHIQALEFNGLGELAEPHFEEAIAESEVDEAFPCRQTTLPYFSSTKLLKYLMISAAAFVLVYCSRPVN